jgi:hypothetical protein
MKPPEQEEVSQAAVGNRLIVGNFNMQIQMPNQASISTTGMIYLDDDAPTLNNRMDMFRAVIQRQQEIAEIPTLEANIEAHDRQIEQLETQLEIVNKKQKSGKKLVSAEQQNVDNLPGALKHLFESREKGIRKIADLKKKHGIA